MSVSNRHDTTQRAFLPPLTCLPSTVTDYVQGHTASRPTNVTSITILSWDLYILAISVSAKAPGEGILSFSSLSNVSDLFQRWHMWDFVEFKLKSLLRWESYEEDRGGCQQPAVTVLPCRWSTRRIWRTVKVTASISARRRSFKTPPKSAGSPAMWVTNLPSHKIQSCCSALLCSARWSVSTFLHLGKIKYKEKHNSNLRGHYEGIDKKTMHAMKARKLASDVSYTQVQTGLHTSHELALYYSCCQIKRQMSVIILVFIWWRPHWFKADKKWSINLNPETD